MAESEGIRYARLSRDRRERWRWLWKPEHVSTAIRYIVDDQGKRMAVFKSAEGWAVAARHARAVS